MTNFTHLHVHDSFSLRDGVSKVDDYLAKAKADGQKSFAITNHGNQYSSIDFYYKAKKIGIKPILGIESYCVRDRFARGNANELKGEEKGKREDGDYKNAKRAWHTLLLAETTEGYYNLIKLLSTANRESYYYNGRIDKKLLGQYSKGLIATSACLGGEINQAILNDDFDWAEDAIKSYIDIFGTDRFFLEVQNHEIEEEAKVRAIIPKLAKKFGLKVVATNDVHYCNKEDKIVQDAVKALEEGLKLDDEELKKRTYKTNHFWFKTIKEMEEMFPGDQREWLENAFEISERCNIELKHDRMPLPEFVKGEENKKSLLRELCLKGFDNLIKPIIPKDRLKEYGDRVKYELDVINKNGFADYFLIVQDIMDFARKNDIPTSPGRGSCCGSLVAYILGITEVEPIEYDLYFERFLNPDRISPPDIDLDFADTRRDEVIEYLKNKYGEKCFVKTITFGNFQPKMALRDSFRLYGHDMEVQSKISKLIPDVLKGIPNIRFAHLYGHNPEFPEAIQPELLKAKEQYPKEFWLAEKLEGNPRHASTHASSYIITDAPIENYAPVDYDAKNAIVRLGIDMYSAEKINLLKMDLLGIETLTILDNAIKDIKKRHNINLIKKSLPKDDKTTWDLTSRGETVGVFQFESDGIRSLLKRAKPKNINELADCNALYRPGAAKFINDYCDVKAGLKEPHPIHPLMEPVLKKTNSVLIFQEQVILMCQVLAGFTKGEADYMRKAIGKKKEEDMQKLIPMFEKGCLKNGIAKETVNEILDWFHDMSRYNFNKSHAVGYSLNAYYAAYVKANYPLEFSKAMLNKKTKELIDYLIRVNDIKRRGIKVHGPSINNSQLECEIINDNEIYFGLNFIKGTNSTKLNEIIKIRESKGKFKDVPDFIEKCKESINKLTLEGLTHSGALDELKVNRKSIVDNIEEFLKELKKTSKKDNRQIDMFGFKEETPIDLITKEDVSDYTFDEKLEQEREVIGFFASGNPLDPYRHLLYDDEIVNTSYLTTSVPNQDNIKIGAFVKSIKDHTDKNGRKMAFLELEDDLGVVKAVLFSKKYDRFKSLLKPRLPLMIEGNLSNGSLLIERMQKLENLCQS